MLSASTLAMLHPVLRGSVSSAALRKAGIVSVESKKRQPLKFPVDPLSVLLKVSRIDASATSIDAMGNPWGDAAISTPGPTTLSTATPRNRSYPCSENEIPS